MANPKVLKLVEATGLKFDVDGDGDVRMFFQESGSDRTQVVYLDGEIDSYGPYEDVDMWSPIVDVRNINDAQKLTALWNATALTHSNKFGGVTMKHQFLAYKVDVPLTNDPAALKAIAGAVASLTDSVENDLTGTDTV
jgi:hypothetical protein